MSSLSDRSGSPRVPPPRRVSRIHPGMEVWLGAFAAGIMLTPAMACVIRGDWWSAGFTGIICLTLMFLTAKKAEGLTEHQ